MQIIGQIWRHLAVRERAVAFLDNALPRTHMHLVDRHGLGETLVLATLRHPLLVVPSIVEIPNDRCEFRWNLVEDRKGIALVDPIAVEARADMVFVKRPFADVGKTAFPNAGLALGMEQMPALLPAVKLADDAHMIGVGRPNRKVRPGFPLLLHDMGSELFEKTK